MKSGREKHISHGITWMWTLKYVTNELVYETEIQKIIWFSSIYFYWSKADLQYCVNFYCTVEWLSYTFCCCCCWLVTQSCPILCSPTDCNPPGSSVHGILQARILEWVTIPFSRGSSRPRNQTQVSCITGRRFTVWASRGAYTHYLFIVFSMVVYHRISNIVPHATQ